MKNVRRLALPLAVALAALAIWDTFVVYPFRVFVVFLHEISHGIAALVTGGRILAIGLTFDEGGVCVTDGGNRFLILNAGYLGSLFWGVLLLVARGAPRPRPRSRVSRGRLHPGGDRRLRSHALRPPVRLRRRRRPPLRRLEAVRPRVGGPADRDRRGELPVRGLGRGFRRAPPRIGGERRQRAGPHHSVSRRPLGIGLGGRLHRRARPHASRAGPGPRAVAAEPATARGRTMST